MKITLNYEVSGWSNIGPESITLTVKPANKGEVDHNNPEDYPVFSSLGAAKKYVRGKINLRSLTADSREYNLYYLRALTDEELLEQYWESFAGSKGELLGNVSDIYADHPIEIEAFTPDK